MRPRHQPVGVRQHCGMLGATPSGAVLRCDKVVAAPAIAQQQQLLEVQPDRTSPFPHVSRPCREALFHTLEAVRYYVARTETTTGLQIVVGLLGEGARDRPQVSGRVQKGDEDRLRSGPTQLELHRDSRTTMKSGTDCVPAPKRCRGGCGQESSRSPAHPPDSAQIALRRSCSSHEPPLNCQPSSPLLRLSGGYPCAACGSPFSRFQSR